MTTYVEQIEQEIKQLPPEYLPALFSIIHVFRESIELKTTVHKKRRQPSALIAGKAQIMSDLTEPCFDSEDFECLK